MGDLDLKPLSKTLVYIPISKEFFLCRTIMDVWKGNKRVTANYPKKNDGEKGEQNIKYGIFLHHIIHFLLIMTPRIHIWKPWVGWRRRFLVFDLKLSNSFSKRGWEVLWKREKKNEKNYMFGSWKVQRKEKKILRLCLVLIKFERKCKRNKIERKSKRK